MTQQAVNNVEQRFRTLKDETDSKDWNNVNDLIEIAERLEDTDTALARRVLQRAKNLAPKNKKVLALLNKLSNQLASTAKEQMVSSSQEQSKSNSAAKLFMTLWSEKVPSSAKILLKKPLVIFVLLPFLMFAFYQIIWASPGYESRAQVIVQQPDGMATMDASMALLSGLGMGGATSNDIELVRKYIYSQDMIDYVQTKVEFLAHYSDSSIDVFSRLSSDASQEDIYQFYAKHVVVELDEKSGVISVFVQGFTPQFALELNLAIVERAEWYINSIGHQLADAQLNFIRQEHQLVEARLLEAKKKLLTFQQENNLLDPEAEGAALQQITYGMESEIASKRAELKALKAVMTAQAPQVVILEAQLNALQTQLEFERERLSLVKRHQGSNFSPESTRLASQSVSQVIASYSDYKIELELALQAYTSSEISLEKARIEAYRQLKFLVVVESATFPQDNQYPKIFYNLTLLLVVLLMIFGIGKVIVATVKELN
ncbi:lipopolysaccharide biosynthesis protein [Shewanella maritima]|uniref:lipopolysaccharide biosynthesis protein n=1 Tax=Shewanella maritima TaxID=2520507 RepID=UPI003735D0B3